MVERWLLAFLARARGSKGGTLLIVVGVFILLTFLVFDLIAVAGNAVLMITEAGPVMEFLATGPGVVAGFAASVFIILLGVAFLTRATPQPSQSVTVNQRVGAAQAERDREVKQLEKRLRRTEEERDRYRAILSDPIAKRRRDEEILRQRCFDLAQEVSNFLIGYSSKNVDVNEAVARFQLRHEGNVTELRDELDKRGVLTATERQYLTLYDHDGLDKISAMEHTLRAIGMGR